MSVSGNNRMLSVKERVLVSLHLGLHDHIKQYNVFELECISGYYMNFDFLAYHHS